MAQIGSILDNKYLILAELGRGGMSVVFLAMDQRLNKQWAIKEISKVGKSQENIRKFRDEAELMKYLDHPTLPRVVDIIDEPDTLYVVMDYIEGVSLRKILEESGPQSEEDVLEWARQLCDALSYLHTLKEPIIYCDMKPANVILKPDNNVKIIDFGAAIQLRSGEKIGKPRQLSPAYAPPEQKNKNDPKAEARSDIYSLGMTLHHLLTGVSPGGKNYAYRPIRQYNPALSDGIEAIIDQCTELDVEDRYQNCTELMYDLEHPELKTLEYRKQQKRKLRQFMTFVITGIVLLVTGIGCNLWAKSINKNDYETLISVMASTSLNEKIESYKQAIGIYPNDTRAYMRMVDAYEENSQFGKKENDELLAVYNAHQNEFDQSSKELAELNYRIGMLYFNYYVNDDGSVNFSNRVQKAYSFFAMNYENKDISQEFEEITLSNCYYQICFFYKKFILNSINVEEASRDDYMDLFEVMDDAILDVSDAGAYDQLTLYNSIFMLLYDQRYNMCSVNVEEEIIIQMLDTVYQHASSLSVQKEQSQRLQKEIFDNYSSYKESIERTYINAKERY